MNVVEPIIGLLKKMITINCLTPSRRACKDIETVYTVLTKPTQRKYRDKLDVFDLVKCEPKGESPKTETPTPVANIKSLNQKVCSFLFFSDAT